MGATEAVAGALAHAEAALKAPPVAPVAAPEALAKTIDHTLLKPEATRGAIEQLCAEAKTHGFATVCVNPLWVPVAAEALKGSGVGVCTVVGFPLGATDAASKAEEARRAVAAGATEVDMVVALGLAMGEDWEAYLADVEAVVAACGPVPVKAILETALLPLPIAAKAGALALAGGVAFLKTSTGFGPGGASLEAVQLLVKLAHGRAQVKASGGIRDRAAALAMLEAGATRLGTSSGAAIVAGAPASGGAY